MRTSTRPIFKHVFVLLIALAALSALGYSGLKLPDFVLPELKKEQKIAPTSFETEKKKSPSTINLFAGSPQNMLECCTNAIDNGSFESGTFTSNTTFGGFPAMDVQYDYNGGPWPLTGSISGADAAKWVQGSGAKEGSKFLWIKAYDDPSPGSVCFSISPYINSCLEEGKRYRVSVWVAVYDPSNSTASATFIMDNNNGTVYTHPTPIVSSASNNNLSALNWQQVTYEFDFSFGDGTPYFSFDNESASSRTMGRLFDDLVIREVSCPVACVKPTLGANVTTAAGTCTGTTPNNNATASLTVTGGDKADIFEGTTYGSGPAYGAGTNKPVTSGAVSFTGLKHTTDYTIRVWNADNTCFEDKTFKTPSKNCIVVPPCTNNLLQNPSFEQGISSTVLSQTPPPGWIAGIAAGFPVGFSPVDGDAFGYTLDDANPTLCQDVTATAGSSYTLTFYAGVNQVMGQKVTLQYYNGTTPIGTAQEHTITHLLSTGQFGGPYTLNLTNAPSKATKIRVCAVGISGNQTAGAAKIDAVCLTETPCVKPTATAAATDPTCASGSSTVNSDGKITLSGFGPTDKYAYTTGATYSGTATYASGSTTIPAGGVIVSNLANPSGATQQYTVRIFNAEGCFIDRTVTINKVTCSCTNPVLTDLTSQAICEGAAFNLPLPT